MPSLPQNLYLCLLKATIVISRHGIKIIQIFRYRRLFETFRNFPNLVSATMYGTVWEIAYTGMCLLPPAKEVVGRQCFSRVRLSVHRGSILPLPMMHWTSLYRDPQPLVHLKTPSPMLTSGGYSQEAGGECILLECFLVFVLFHYVYLLSYHWDSFESKLFMVLLVFHKIAQCDWSLPSTTYDQHIAISSFNPEPIQ